MATNEEKTSWLAGLLSGWGIKESWAKIIAGAIIGALAAMGALTQTGCTASYSQSAEGDISSSVTIAPPVTQSLTK